MFSNSNKCYYHPNIAAFATCEACKHLICHNEVRKLNNRSGNIYCVLCFEKILQKRTNPLIFLIIFGIPVIFLDASVVAEGMTVIDIIVALLINGLVVMSFIFLYIITLRRNRKAKQEAQQFRVYLKSRNQDLNISPRKCPNCNSVTNSDSNYCQACGYALNR